MSTEITPDQVAALFGRGETDFTVPQVAALRKVSESTVYRDISTGKMDAYRLGERGIRITPEAVVKSLTSNGTAGDNDVMTKVR